MNDLLNRRSDYPLLPGQQEELHAELLTAIESGKSRTSRRLLVPLAAAAAVLAVVAGLALGVRALEDNKSAPASDSGTGQPATRDLSAADTATLRGQCEAEADAITSRALPRPFRNYKVLSAFEFVDVKAPGVVKTWLIGTGVPEARKPPKGAPQDPPDMTPGYWLCSRTAAGVISESSINYPGKAILSDGVGRFAHNGGVYLPPVVRVTVQPKGKPEIDAVLRGGFWFAPTEGRTGRSQDETGYQVRGYDAAGRKIFDTAEVPKAIYCQVPGTTPAATPPVDTCRLLEWPS